MDYAGGESGPRRKFEKQSSDSALGVAADLVYGGAETRRSSDGGAAAAAMSDRNSPSEAQRQRQRRMSGPAEVPLAFQQRHVGPAGVPLASEPPAGAGGPPVSQLLHQHAAAGTSVRPREALGLEYSGSLNDAHVAHDLRGHGQRHEGPASRAAAVAEAGRRREQMTQDDAHYGQMSESPRTINVYENMMLPAAAAASSSSAHNNKNNRAPRRKKRGNKNRHASGNSKPAAQRAAEEEEEHKRQREAYMSSNIYVMTSAGQEGGVGGAASQPKRGEEGHLMHTHTLALNDTAAAEGETIGRKVGRIARRMSLGALSAVSGLTGPGDSMYGDSSSSSESSDDDGHDGGRRRYGGGINTMGKIGFDGPATGAWEGDMMPMPMPPSGAQTEEEMMLQHHHANWEKPKQWKPPEEPTLGRKIGRMARRMSGGALSAGVLSGIRGDSDEEGGLRRGQRKASSINLSTLARLDFDGLSDDQDPTGRQTTMDNHADARIAAEHGEIASAGGSGGNAVPFTIDVGSRGGRRQSGRRAGRRRSRGSHSPSGPTSLRDLPIFNAVGDINPGDVDVGVVQTSYYQDARDGARRAVKKGKKMARRMSSGSLLAMGFDMTADDDDSDSSDDAPEPGDADYVPPQSADKSVRGNVGNGYAKIRNDADNAMASRASRRSSRAPRRGSLVNYIRVSARKLHESGIGEFDPDNIVTIGMDDEAEEHELEMQKRRRISLCVAIGILVAVVAAFAGGTAKVFMWWGPGSSSDRIGGIKQPNELPEPPSDLDRVCSVRNMATEAGHKDCEKLCSPATCCMKSGEDSCYSEHKSLCEKVSEINLSNEYLCAGGLYAFSGF